MIVGLWRFHYRLADQYAVKKADKPRGRYRTS